MAWNWDDSRGGMEERESSREAEGEDVAQEEARGDNSSVVNKVKNLIVI